MVRLIKQARLIKGYSQTEVATCLGFKQSNYSQIEQGHTDLLAKDLIILARLLDIDLNVLANNVNVFPYLKTIDEIKKVKQVNIEKQRREFAERSRKRFQKREEQYS